MRNPSTIKSILGNIRAGSTIIPSLRNVRSINASSSTAVVVRSQRFATSSNVSSMNECYFHDNTLSSKRCSNRPYTSQNYCMNKRRAFSQEASAAKEEQQQKEEAYVFKHPKSQDIFEKLSKLQLEEVRTVVELMYSKLGVTITEADKLRAKGRRSAAVASGGDGGEEAGKEEEKVEKTHFDLKLSGFDAKSKIKVIKEVRAISGLGLKEAKELVEGAPKVVKKDLKLEEAEELKKKLEDIGATVELD